MLSEVGDEPGNLTLLEHGLDQLWQKRKSGAGVWITHASYDKIGRLAGALRNHANAAMGRLPDEEARTLARRFFVELAQLGEGREDTSRRVKIEDLKSSAPDKEKAVKLLDQLAAERLITVGEEYAEVAHEALIRSWPELRRWIDKNRKFVQMERRFLQDAQEWERLNRVNGALLVGPRLVEAEEWLSSVGRDVSPWVREFVERSAAERRRLDEERIARERATQAQLLVVQAQLLEKDRPQLIESRARAVSEDLSEPAVGSSISSAEYRVN